MLKVVVITSSFPLFSGSRSGVFVEKLIDSLPDDIHAKVLVPDDASSGSDLVSGSYEIIRFRYAPKRFQKLAHAPGGIVSTLKNNKWTCLLIPPFLLAAFLTTLRHAVKADVIYANWSINGVIGGLIGVITKKPVVTTLRGTDVNKLKDSRLFRSMIKFCLRYNARVVTVSNSLQRTIRDVFPEATEKMSVIHNGIDNIYFDLVSVETGDVLRLVCIGNLIKEKGVNFIIDALKDLVAYQWRLEIVGDGPERKTLENFCITSEIAKRVVFRGAVPPEHIPKILKHSDMFVFASLQEGRPNVVVEAMATGLSIVASNIPSVCELIQDGKQGFLFSNGKVDSLRRRLEYAFSHPEERKKAGEAARESILQAGNTWTETAKQYAALFQEVIHERQGRI